MMTSVISEIARIADANEATHLLLTNELANNAANSASIANSVEVIANNIAVFRKKQVVTIPIWNGGADNDPLAGSAVQYLAYIPAYVVVSKIAVFAYVTEANSIANCWRVLINVSSSVDGTAVNHVSRELHIVRSSATSPYVVLSTDFIIDLNNPWIMVMFTPIGTPPPTYVAPSAIVEFL